MLDPIRHAEAVTGCGQSALIDLWATTGFAAALSDVTGPRIYNYGELPVTTVAITLYDVRRHVLIENGRVRRDGPVLAGRFRIGQPGRTVVVDAIPDVKVGKLLILYLGKSLLNATSESEDPVELMDRTWDTDDPFLSLAARRLVDACARQDMNPKDRGLKDIGTSLFAEQLAYTLALHLSDRYAARKMSTEPRRLPTLDRNLCARITEAVRTHPGRDISIAQMAEIAGLSPSHFIRCFKRATGVTPHRFVIEQRVLAAQDMIRRSDTPIAEVAVAVGFSSQSHLGTAFRAVTGLSPARFRRLHCQ